MKRKSGILGMKQKQMRFFVLYQSGQIYYYHNMNQYKGVIGLSPRSQVRKKEGKNTIIITGTNSKKKDKKFKLSEPKDD